MANNPPKDSMTKLGTCTITVEPHIFEASMWAIKDPTPRPAIPPNPQQQPMYRPIIQYGPPNGMMPPPSRPLPQQVSPPQPVHQASSKPQDTPMTNSASSAQAANPLAGTPGHQPHTNTAAPNAQHAPNMIPNPPPANAQPAVPAAKRTDPVIQMLAEEAATDPTLKALMKTVANGEASPAELKQFQSHIDQLTRLHKIRQGAKEWTSDGQGRPPQTPAAPPTPGPGPGHEHIQPSPGPSPTQGPIPRATPTAAAPSPGPAHPAALPHSHTHPPAPGPRPEPHYQPQPQPQPQPQALRSKGPLPSTKPDITGVVFEFTGGSGDRFLFPKFSILEYLPQGQVIASFLIVRKGSTSDSPAYDPELDYYQPITIRLYAHQGRQLDALQKVVAPPDEVRRYMDDIMDNMTRAEYVLLAMRLPRDTEPTPAAKEVEPNKPIRMDDQVLWTTTNPTPPNVQIQPATKLLTEEEKYQSFISTVS